MRALRRAGPTLSSHERGVATLAVPPLRFAAPHFLAKRSGFFYLRATDGTVGDSNGNYCEPVANFADDDPDDHGTVVSSIVLGDYQDGQGNGVNLRDAAFSAAACSTSFDCGGQPCESGQCAHSATWETRATGVAPEASLIYFGGMNADDGGTADITAAFADGFDRNVDAITNSWGWMPAGSDACSPVANLSFERDAEDAFDDGIFVTACAGNSNLGDGCNV
ncbi:S8 family serine peptidase [Sorangium sp. So ce726]|uniref:S8 family serine peptidase n=1 Tax=Sorangium sp. So ce726 TaxID=3133319 RepID=UPI003F5E369C